MTKVLNKSDIWDRLLTFASLSNCLLTCRTNQSNRVRGFCVLCPRAGGWRRRDTAACANSLRPAVCNNRLLRSVWSKFNFAASEEPLLAKDNFSEIRPVINHYLTSISQIHVFTYRYSLTSHIINHIQEAFRVSQPILFVLKNSETSQYLYKYQLPTPSPSVTFD